MARHYDWSSVQAVGLAIGLLLNDREIDKSQSQIF
jgi:hypothetical protein